ncbi:MAG: carbohydrate-binding family 9-like protein, partial [Armatimonadetes bacterium]|nr:carbohydrate-binding family 9-like protein [Armatimonadota bacterium]
MWPVAVWLLSVTLAAPVPVILTDQKPTVDGRLDDPVWRQGEWLDGLHVPGEAEPAPLQVRFKVAMDRESFYVAAQVEEPNRSGLKAPSGPETRDAHLWNEDCVEVFLDCGTGGEEYYHFIVNPRGALYDAWNRRGFRGNAAAWNGDVEAAAAVADAGWTGELA